MALQAEAEVDKAQLALQSQADQAASLRTALDAARERHADQLRRQYRTFDDSCDVRWAGTAQLHRLFETLCKLVILHWQGWLVNCHTNSDVKACCWCRERTRAGEAASAAAQHAVCPNCDPTCQQVAAAKSEQLRSQLESMLATASAGRNSAKAAQPGPHDLIIA